MCYTLRFRLAITVALCVVTTVLIASTLSQFYIFPNGFQRDCEYLTYGGMATLGTIELDFRVVVSFVWPGFMFDS